MMTQLRLLNEGLDLAEFQQQFGQSLAETYNGTLDQMLDWELVAVRDGRLRLTQKGWFLSNQVFYRFMLDETT
jgi:oxygen-independent coproporphyrinogen-3 oxidase